MENNAVFLRLLKNILDIVCDAATKVNQQGVNDDEDEFEEIKEEEEETVDVKVSWYLLFNSWKASWVLEFLKHFIVGS